MGAARWQRNRAQLEAEEHAHGQHEVQEEWPDTVQQPGGRTIQGAVLLGLRSGAAGAVAAGAAMAAVLHMQEEQGRIGALHQR